MKNWIKVIFALNSRLDAMTELIDGQVNEISTDLCGQTLELMDNIIRLNDKKVRLINLRVLHDKLTTSLSKREIYVLQRIAKGASYQGVANELSLSKEYIHHIFLKAVHKCSKILISYGYDADKLNAEYSDIELISRMYKKISRKKIAI